MEITGEHALRSVRYVEIDGTNRCDDDEWDVVSCCEDCSVIGTNLNPQLATRPMGGD